MPLNIQKGNMYGFVTHTWNVIKGKCAHDCSYCYMKRWGEQKPLRFDEKELNTNLGEGNFIFVGSSTDMFSNDVSEEWILRVLAHCLGYPKNRYLFQTKNPKRLVKFAARCTFPKDVIFGITMETNKISPSEAPSTEQRAYHMTQLHPFTKKMVTIEPIMDFDLEILVDWIKKVEPEFVNIGADSTNNDLPEPSSEKIGKLIKELEKFTKVNLKDNLKRIYEPPKPKGL